MNYPQAPDATGHPPRTVVVAVSAGGALAVLCLLGMVVRLQAQLDLRTLVPALASGLLGACAWGCVAFWAWRGRTWALRSSLLLAVAEVAAGAVAAAGSGTVRVLGIALMAGGAVVLWCHSRPTARRFTAGSRAAASSSAEGLM